MTIRPILKISRDCCQYTKRRLSSNLHHAGRGAVIQNYPTKTITKKFYLQDSSRALSSQAAAARVSWWEAGNLNGRDRNPNAGIIASSLYYDPYRLSSYRMMSSTSFSSEKLQVGKNEDDDIHDSKNKEPIIQTDSSCSSSSNNNFNDILDIDKKDNNNYHIVTVKSQTKLTERKPNKQSFRSMVRQYGPVFIGTYGVVYVSTVFGLFMGVQSGVLDATSIMAYLSGTASSTPAGAGGVDDPDTIQSAASTMTYMVDFLEYYSWTKPLAPIVQENPWTANFGIAWIMTKFTEPIRFGITVAVTPSIAKKLGYGPTAQNSPPSPDGAQPPPIPDDVEQSTSSSSSTEKK
jgi:hypothetical protein